MPTVLEAMLPRGACPVHAFGELEHAAAPIVFVFMDAFGPRPACFDIAERLAGEGYKVLLPDLFYAHLPYRPLDPASLFSGGEDRARLGVLVKGLDQAAIDGDVAALLAFSDARFGDAAPLAATGYCMGGRYSLTAASLGARVALAACFHASNLAPEQGSSAHRRLAGTQARVYVGIAELDPSFGAAEEGRLAQALREANVDHMLETYAGAAHGFVMPDLPVYNPAAAERHWQRLRALLREAFTTSR